MKKYMKNNDSTFLTTRVHPRSPRSNIENLTYQIEGNSKSLQKESNGTTKIGRLKAGPQKLDDRRLARKNGRPKVGP